MSISSRLALLIAFASGILPVNRCGHKACNQNLRTVKQAGTDEESIFNDFATYRDATQEAIRFLGRDFREEGFDIMKRRNEKQGKGICMTKATQILEGARRQVELKGYQILEDQYGDAAAYLATACALLTSSVKAEREEGKAMVREWRKAGTNSP